MNRLLQTLHVGLGSQKMPESQLLELFSSTRDSDAFAELVSRHGSMVWGVCRRNLQHSADAEDAFQATFLVLVRRAASLPSTVRLGPWLYRVAVRCCKTVQRSNSRRLRRVQIGLSPATAAVEPNVDSDLGVLLDAAILALPEKYRVPVILCHLQGWTRKEAAQHLGCPDGTLSVRLDRALAKLRSKLVGREVAVALAAAGSMVVPESLVEAALTIHSVEQTASACIPPAVLRTSQGVLRMFRVKQLQLAAVAVFATMGLLWLGMELFAGSDSPTPVVTISQLTKQSEPPVLTNGRWELLKWMTPDTSHREATIVVSERNGKQAVVKVEECSSDYQPKELTVSGSRVTFKLRNGNSDMRFDGLFDPADPTKVNGSIWSTSSIWSTTRAYRAVLILIPAGGKRILPKPETPREWERFLELDRDRFLKSADTFGPAFEKKPKAEQDRLRVLALDAENKLDQEVPKLFRKLAAERPESPFGYEVAMGLLAMLDCVKLSPDEVEIWSIIARNFAATHGPQFEASTTEQIAKTLIRLERYHDQAVIHAATADKLLTDAGMPADSVKTLAKYDEERAAWARQADPPAPGVAWSVTVSGKVTDSKGQPVEDAKVYVNNTRWVKIKPEEGRTGPDGQFKLTVTCVGSYRLHIHRMVVEKKGFVNSENREEHVLLPGESATVNFTMKTVEEHLARVR